MDSRIDTYEHIREVQSQLFSCVEMLLHRAYEHDRSKLGSPEKEIFDEYTPKLSNSTYGSDEYKRFLAGMKPALDHHYAYNRHHPEHFANGLAGMNLFDLMEMFCDWLAATKRHKDGDIERSIEVNQKRFGYSDELKSILMNTANKFLGCLETWHCCGCGASRVRGNFCEMCGAGRYDYFPKQERSEAHA